MKIPLYALPHRVTLTPLNGTGAYGAQYGTPKEKVPCNIQPKTRLIRSASGEDIEQTALAIFPAGTVIKRGDRVEWPAYDLKYRVAQWTPIEMMGPHSVEVVLENG